MKRRVLIVSPHFPPVSTPDMQRVRTVLPFLSENGWEAEVLTVSHEQVAAPLDPWLAANLPSEVIVRRVDALSLGLRRVPGFGTLGLRALPALAKEGERALRTGSFDLVYFSTTVFEVHVLGPRWRREWGVPFVMDFQDPWVNDYYREHPDVVPPGGRLKYALADALHRWMEPRVLRHCSGITCVSPDYPAQLARRYPMFEIPRCLVQPFPGGQRDFDNLEASGVAQRFFRAGDGRIHWVYAGAIVPGMLPAVRALMRSISTGMSARMRKHLRLHFIGTSYAVGKRAVPRVLPIAREMGLAENVEEWCERVPYAEAIKCLVDADAIVAIGSDDASYVPSKLVPCLLAGKPLLAAYPTGSAPSELIARVGGAVRVPFSLPIDEHALADAISTSWSKDEAWRRPPKLDRSMLEPYTDRGSAAILCRFFDSVGGSSLPAARG